ncbi:signal transduction histidine kinase [Scopulibacillus darangshiensis]|uniref:histidine kinase n=1 Tax=Scopulibacillus darangshiensis TaxID=442528 RepID=A0A4R2P3Q3_9BACL|nr:HAMP domain-containing sensor histidine kinase [Scopulibacillus darangshiensis]TCP29400.1 signal transduction histidine kinase [Scopulibacillus darangshiensis]
MDTKWKNSLVVLIWLILLTFGISGILSLITQGSQYIGSYYQTPRFDNDLNQFIGGLQTYELDAMTKEEAIDAIHVTEDDINTYRNIHYGDLPTQLSVIKDNYKQKITDAEAENNKDAVKKLKAARTKKLKDITEIFKNDELIKKKIKKNKAGQINAYYSNLNNQYPLFNRYKQDFKYYLKDTKTGKVYTNLKSTQDPDKYFKKDMVFIRSYPSANYGYLSVDNGSKYGNGELMHIINQTPRNFEGTIAVPKSLPADSIVMEGYHTYHKGQVIFFIYTISSIVALVLSLLLLRTSSVIEYRSNIKEKWQPIYNRIPLDACLLIFIVTIVIILQALTMSMDYYSYIDPFAVFLQIIIPAIIVALTLIQIILLKGRLKGIGHPEIEWQKSLVRRSFKGIREAFFTRNFGFQSILVLGVIFASGFGLTVVLLYPQTFFIYIPLFIIVTIPTLVITTRWIGRFNRMIDHTSELIKGKSQPDLPAKGHSAIAILSGNINRLKQGVRVSQEKQVKSERLKTELITNVSHDLRTPLTSIITYTELLKTPELLDDDRSAYIDIIDRKSKRLKVLIDDLFEASKMASGNIDLVKDKVDINQLLEQGLAENDESISDSTLQFRVTKPDSPVICFADGQKLWRVFDNLIGNILKYALEGTRVFIAVKTVNSQAVITFKNITKYELSENIDELFERFKRGDTSRHTEGSGLGLAIAKSIIDLHDGTMDIEVDGDLFKVTITLDLS